MHKWRLEDNTIKCLCEECSKKHYDQLVIRESWKASEADKKMKCEYCGTEAVVQREGKV